MVEWPETEDAALQADSKPKKKRNKKKGGNGGAQQECSEVDKLQQLLSKARQQLAEFEERVSLLAQLQQQASHDSATISHLTRKLAESTRDCDGVRQQRDQACHTLHSCHELPDIDMVRMPDLILLTTLAALQHG